MKEKKKFWDNDIILLVGINVIIWSIFILRWITGY